MTPALLKKIRADLRNTGYMAWLPRALSLYIFMRQAFFMQANIHNTGIVTEITELEKLNFWI